MAGGSLIGRLTKIARDLLLFCAVKQVLVETISLRSPQHSACAPLDPHFPSDNPESGALAGALCVTPEGVISI